MTDPFETFYPIILRNAFSIRSADPSHANHALINDIYLRDPAAFRIITGAHQNHSTDLFHIGVEVRILGGRATQRYHINGYWKGRFVLVSLTREHFGTIETIALWNPPETSSKAAKVDEETPATPNAATT